MSGNNHNKKSVSHQPNNSFPPKPLSRSSKSGMEVVEFSMNPINRCAPQDEELTRVPPPSTPVNDTSTTPTTEHTKKMTYIQPSSCMKTSNDRKNLIVLIQIMLKYFDNKDRRLRVAVKKEIANCTQRNREGHPDYRFLVDSINNRLRLLVGDEHWSKIERLLKHYRKMKAEAGARNAIQNFAAI